MSRSVRVDDAQRQPPGTSATVAPAPDASPELLERAAELALLDRLLDRVRAGEGSRVLILGPSGIGKSSLLAAATASAAGRGLTVLRSAGREEDRGAPHALAHRLLGDRLARDELPSEPRAAAARLAQVVLDLAAQRPLVLAVDDAHLADVASLRALALLAERLPAAPMLLALALHGGAAVGEEAAWEQLRDERRATVVRPAPLSREAAARVLELRLGHPPGAPLLDACQVQAGGNPLLLTAVGEAIRQAGAAERPEPAGWVAELGSSAVAHTVAGRLAELSPAARSLAEGSAVVGELGDLARIAAVTELDPSVAEDAAAELRAREFVRSAATLEPLHPLVREAIRAGVPAGRREQLARRAVDLLTAEGHVAQAGSRLLALPPRGKKAAACVLWQAARSARAHGSPDAALVLLRRALAEPPAPELRRAIGRELARVLLALGDGAAVEALREELAGSETAEERAAAVQALAEALTRVLRFGEACAVLEETASGLRATRADLSEELEAEAARLARFDPALLEHRRALMRRLPRGREASELAHRLRLVQRASDLGTACAPATETVALAERALAGGLLLSRAPAAHAVAIALLVQHGRASLARAAVSEAIAHARARGEVVRLAVALSLLGELARREGSLGAAEAGFRTALELASGRAAGPPFMLAGLLETLVDRGRLADAEAELSGAGTAGELPDVLTRGLMLHARARVRLAAGALHLALEDLLLAGQDLRRLHCESPAAVPWRGTAAEALLALGDRERAVELSAEQLRMAERIGVPAVLGAALRVHGLALGGERAGEPIARAVSLLAHTNARLEYARALVDLAGTSAAASPARARELLQQALTLGEELDADSLVDRARGELVAAGGRPRRRTRGPGALTPAERRVAELAAHGLSNREIAETLVVARKTVETHLAATYRKLGVRSRAELAGWGEGPSAA